MNDDKSDEAADRFGAANQSRARAYNKRLVLSHIRRRDKMSKSEIAKRTGLSVQAVSVIINSLEEEELLLRGEPIRGKHRPAVLEGQLGAKASAIGAACLPLYSQYLLDQNVLFKVVI